MHNIYVKIHLKPKSHWGCSRIEFVNPDLTPVKTLYSTEIVLLSMVIHMTISIWTESDKINETGVLSRGSQTTRFCLSSVYSSVLNLRSSKFVIISGVQFVDVTLYHFWVL